MKVAIHALPAFIRDGGGGTPTGVALDAEGLSDPEMRAAARLAGLPITVFVLPSRRAQFHFRFFTPKDEVDHSTRAAVAAFSLMRSCGRIRDGEFSQESRLGVRKVEVRADGLVLVDQKHPEFFEDVSAATAAEALGIAPAWIDATGMTPRIVSLGLRDLIVPVADRAKLRSLDPDPERLRKLTWSYDVIGLHAFTLDASRAQAAAEARNFSPLYGIREEAATATAAGALACFLARAGRGAGPEMVFDQGDQVGRPCEIRVGLCLEAGAINRVRVGGRADALGARVVEVDLPGGAPAPTPLS